MNEELPTDKRSFLRPLIALQVVALLVGGIVLWLAWDEDSPDRIFVAVRHEEGAFGRALRQRLGRRLGQKGFVVASEEEDANAATDLGWDEALAAADTADARYLVYVEGALESSRPGLTEGTTFAVASASVRVGPVDASEAEPSEARSLTFGAEGRGTAEDALLEMVSSFAEPMAHWAAGDLLAMPALVERLENPEQLADAERQNALGDALSKKAGQDRSRQRFHEVCTESVVQATLDDELGPAVVQCLDIDCGERYLFDLSADGGRALVHVESPTVYVPFATSPAPQTAETVERLELIPFDDEAERRTLALAESFFGYGSMSADGSRVVFVEQARQRFGVVALDVESGERRVVTVVDRPGLVVEANVSPDGEWIAFERKAFHRAHTELHLVPFGGGEPRVLSRRTRMARWVVAPLRPGEEPRLLIALEGTESYEEEPAPALLDPAADPAELVALDVGEHVVRQVVGAHDGELVLLGSPEGDVDQCALGIRDAATGEFEWRDIATCIGGASTTDRFEVIGTAMLSREGDLGDDDPEVIIMSLETGNTAIHTTNRGLERYPRAANRRIVFERAITSQFPAVHPSAVCWTTR